MAVDNEVEYARLRRDVGASEDVLPNEMAEEYFVESLEMFPSDSAKMKAQARVIALQGIRASAAMLGKYAQNQSQEDLTKVFDNLTIMLEEAKAAVAVAAEPVDQSNGGTFFFGVAEGRRGQGVSPFLY
jgi:hypothetical protein